VDSVDKCGAYSIRLRQPGKGDPEPLDAESREYWEIIADNLSKAGGVGAVYQPWIRAGERSGLQMRISLWTRRKS
jgi:hypothetical protein